MRPQRTNIPEPTVPPTPREMRSRRVRCRGTKLHKETESDVDVLVVVVMIERKILNAHSLEVEMWRLGQGERGGGEEII
eukprot:12566507-Ditylum_brightwellii.AAC.1